MLSFKDFVFEKENRLDTLDTRLVIKDWLQKGEKDNPTERESEIYAQLNTIVKKLAKTYGVDVDWNDPDDVEDFYSFKFNSILMDAGGMDYLTKKVK